MENTKEKEIVYVSDANSIPILHSSSVNKLVNSSHVNLFFALASLGYVVRALHSHERVHLNSKCLLYAESIVPERASLAVGQAGWGRAENRKATRSRRYRKAGR